MTTRRQFVGMIALSAPIAALGLPVLAQDKRAGSFEGKSRHVTTGTASIEKTSDGYVVRLGADFTFDGAPDPKVALGNDGYDASTLMGPLASNTGEQIYPIPAGIDPNAYNEVWIWCERFAVPLGLAKLN